MRYHAIDAKKIYVVAGVKPLMTFDSIKEALTLKYEMKEAGADDISIYDSWTGNMISNAIS